MLAGNVSATVLRQQLAVVREQVQSGAQHQTRVHADLADALSEAARLKSDLAALTGAAGRENANSSTELLKDEIQLGDADNALTSLHAQLLAVQSELKASLRQQAQERALSSDVEVRLVVELPDAMSFFLSMHNFFWHMDRCHQVHPPDFDTFAG